jgi:hypothetical protein
MNKLQHALLHGPCHGRDPPSERSQQTGAVGASRHDPGDMREDAARR